MRFCQKKLFEELSHRCEPENVYSVREVAASMGINYDYIALCASKNKRLSAILQMCRGRCECHAVNAGLHGKLSIREVHKYWVENDDEYAREWGYEQVFDNEKHRYHRYH